MRGAGSTQQTRVNLTALLPSRFPLSLCLLETPAPGPAVLRRASLTSEFVRATFGGEGFVPEC